MTTDRMQTVVIDLDSTLADTSPRHHLVPTEDLRRNESWHAYSLACGDDLPLPGMIALARLLDPDHIIVLLSGRNDIAEPESRKWLALQEVPFDELRLRRDDELGSVSDYKIQALRELRQDGHDIVLMIDDFPDICASVTRELGIPTITPQLPLHYAAELPGL